jgi:hypothetical protein
MLYFIHKDFGNEYKCDLLEPTRGHGVHNRQRRPQFIHVRHEKFEKAHADPYGSRVGRVESGLFANW